ncbi:MAG TPA: hypothetical protein VGB51_05640 [Actinomycetota bacterium]
MTSRNGPSEQLTAEDEISVHRDPSWESHDLAPGDIGRLVRALLAGIERGELEATPHEVEFLSSIGEILVSDSA